MNEYHKKVKITEALPPESDKKNLSKQVLVFDKEKKFIGQDSYNFELKRWRINKNRAVYWLKETTVNLLRLESFRKIVKHSINNKDATLALLLSELVDEVEQTTISEEGKQILTNLIRNK